MTGTDAFMPLYIGDYLRDTTRLTTVEHGAYLLLLMDSWVNGPPPDNDQVLAAITRLMPAQWRKVRETLASYFRVEDGYWHQKRVEKERAKAAGMFEIKRAAGKAGGIAARGKSGRKPNSKTIAAEIANLISEPIAKELQNNTHSQSHSQSQEKVAAGARVPVELFCDELGIRFQDNPKRLDWPAKLHVWLSKGGFMADLLAAARRAKERGDSDKPIAWFFTVSEDFKAERIAKEAASKQEAYDWRMRFLQNYNLPVPDDEVGKMEGIAGRGGWRWIKNTSGNGVWQDVFGIGPPPHDPHTLVTEKEIDFYPGARAMRDKLKGASH